MEPNAMCPIKGLNPELQKLSPPEKRRRPSPQYFPVMQFKGFLSQTQRLQSCSAAFSY